MIVTELTPDVAYRTKLYLATAVVGLLIVVPMTAFGYFVGMSEGGPASAQLGVTIALAINAIWLVPTLILIPRYYRSLHYEIHDDEIIVRVGVWTHSVKHVPFRTVTNIKVNKDPFDRLLGIGSLNIQTAGMSGQGGAEESLVGLPDVQAVYDQVAARLRRFRTAMSPTQADEAPPANDRELLAAMLEELRALRRDLSRVRV